MAVGTQTQVGEAVLIPAGEVDLPGLLCLPENPCGVILIAEDRERSRFGGRPERLAGRLRSAGLGTLTIDLLTPKEATRRRPVATVVALMAERLLETTRWLHASYYGLPVGILGLGTAGAAALSAASQAPHLVEAVVCAGGLPALPREVLEQVRSPTLWLVAADDPLQQEHCRGAFQRLACARALEFVPGAGPHFEGGSSLEWVANAGRHWFVRHLAGIGTHEWRVARR